MNPSCNVRCFRTSHATTMNMRRERGIVIAYRYLQLVNHSQILVVIVMTIILCRRRDAFLFRICSSIYPFIFVLIACLLSDQNTSLSAKNQPNTYERCKAGKVIYILDMSTESEMMFSWYCPPIGSQFVERVIISFRSRASKPLK